MSHIRTGLVALAAVTVGTVIFAAAASADSITSQGALSGNRYHGGVPSAGGIAFSASVQVNRDPVGEITNSSAWCSPARPTQVNVRLTWNQ